MIVDHIQNWRKYALLHRIASAFQILEGPHLAEKKTGRYEVEDGSGVYYLIQNYVTLPKAECKLEAHKKYVDLHLIIKGEETIGYVNVRDKLKVKEQYNKDTDAIFYESVDSIKMSSIKFTSGMFAVFLPQDAHMPKLQTNNRSKVIKAVVKIPEKIFC